MNSRRPDGKLEAGLRPVLHFLGDFYEIPSIYFITRWPRRRSFQNDFVKGMELSFVLHRASDEARLDSRIPLRAPHRLRPQDRARSNRTYSQSSRSDAFEAMQGNFGKTIKADRNGRASHTNRGVCALTE
jgi:hypothetical protein